MNITRNNKLPKVLVSEIDLGQCCLYDEEEQEQLLIKIKDLDDDFSFIDLETGELIELTRTTLVIPVKATVDFTT